MDTGINSGITNRPIIPVKDPETIPVTPPEPTSQPNPEPETKPKPEQKPKPKPSPETLPNPEPSPETPGSPSQEPEGDDGKPEMSGITDDDGNGGDVWDGNVGKNTSDNGAFIENNIELLKKINNILEFIYPDSGIDLAKLLTGFRECIVMFEKRPGGGGESGNGQNENDSENIGSKPTDYIEYEARFNHENGEPDEKGKIKRNVDAIISLIKNLAEKNIPSEIPTFESKNIISKNDVDWVIYDNYTIYIKLTDYILDQDTTNKINDKNNYSNFEALKTTVFLQSLGIQVKSEKKTKISLLNVARYSKYSNDDIKHTFKELYGNRSVNSANIANYLNELFKKYSEEKEKIKNEVKSVADKQFAVYKLLADEIKYDHEEEEKKYQFSNNKETAIAYHKSCCYGIANAYSTIMKELNINNIGVVSSKVLNHAWNYDSEGYWYDITGELIKQEYVKEQTKDKNFEITKMFYYHVKNNQYFDAPKKYIYNNTEYTMRINTGFNPHGSLFYYFDQDMNEIGLSINKFD